jgi:isoaspartyl peptidase/L-asparaginase-like protein (Ntn-hydrolase superfamily)
MKTRRNFLKKSAIGAVGTMLLPNITKARMNKTNKQSEKGFPIVISTWRHGIPANEGAIKVLQNGGKAIDAVEAGVRIPEADPEVSSVGFGGWPDRDGHVTLDACIMDETGNCGSVSFLEGIMHPISVARLVMERTPHVMLAGKGAQQFALENGFKKENLLIERAEKKWKKWLEKSEYKPIINIENHDTIGLLAIDKKGDISGACTTSGLSWKLHGRVGDSPVIGAGMYVDNEVGGCCATGVGEAVLKTLGSFLVVELMRQGATPQEACEEAIARIVKNQNYEDMQIGYLAINKKGEHGAYAVHPGFNYALHQNGSNTLIDSESHTKK